MLLFFKLLFLYLYIIKFNTFISIIYFYIFELGDIYDVKYSFFNSTFLFVLNTFQSNYIFDSNKCNIYLEMNMELIVLFTKISKCICFIFKYIK